jgi:hypothetical protein
VRERTIRVGNYAYVGREWDQSESMQNAVIPLLERQLGPNHRLVHKARHHAEQLRDTELEAKQERLEKLGRRMRAVSWLPEE